MRKIYLKKVFFIVFGMVWDRFELWYFDLDFVVFYMEIVGEKFGVLLVCEREFCLFSFCCSFFFLDSFF